MDKVTQTLNHRDILMEEISIIKSRYTPEDTGHLRTTVSVLEERVEELKLEMLNDINK